MVDPSTIVVIIRMARHAVLSRCENGTKKEEELWFKLFLLWLPV